MQPLNDVATGLRMVADAIDPPESGRLADQEWIDRHNPMREIAETLAGPKVVVGEMPGPCATCGSLTHITIAHPERQT